MVRSSSPSLLLPSYWEPSCTVLTQVEAWHKTPLNAINTKSFPLVKRSYKLYALVFSPEVGRRRELAKACGVFVWLGFWWHT